MAKIIYKPTGEEVNIGTTITTNEGFNLIFNLNLFNDNPHMFKVLNDISIKDALKKAKQKYDKGIKYIDLYGNKCKSKGNLYIKKDQILENGFVVYDKGVFAETIQPLFKSYDGYYIYDNDQFFYIYNNMIDAKIASDEFDYSDDYEKYYKYEIAKVRFSEIEQKEFEIMLCERYGYNFIDDLKFHTPHLYFRLMFEEISKKLNPCNWKPKHHTTKYFIQLYIDEFFKEDIVVKSHNSVKYDLIYFATKENADLAIKIMGENIKYVV